MYSFWTVKGIFHPKKLTVITLVCFETHTLLWETNGDVGQNVQAALFYTMEVNGDHECQARFYQIMI